MKKILIALFAIASFISCKHEGFNLSCEIKDGRGLLKDAKVTIIRYNEEGPETIGEATVSDGSFKIRGNTEPCRVYVSIDANKEGEEDYGKIYSFPIYIENSDIKMKIDMDSVSEIGYEANIVPVVEGSSVHDTYSEFQNSIGKYLEEERDLHRRYLDAYQKPSLTGNEDIEQSVIIASSLKKVKKNIRDVKKQFITAHASSPVALEMFSDMLNGMYIEYTAGELDEMKNALYAPWKDNSRFMALAEKAENAKAIAIGEKYPDIELFDKEGKAVKLSGFIPEGKFVMLEFWASWCGPCRGEIPHLKKVFEKYSGKDFDIVSISLDEKESDWLKALKEENMSWTQLRDGKSFEGPVMNTYMVTGVPYCIMLDRNGIIVETEVRGAFLNAFLENNI